MSKGGKVRQPIPASASQPASQPARTGNRHPRLTCLHLLHCVLSEAEPHKELAGGGCLPHQGRGHGFGRHVLETASL